MKKPRGILVAGNWKMNHGPKAALDFFRELSTELPKAQAGVSCTLFTPSVTMAPALEPAKKLGISIGSQNTHWETSGAFTGEISLSMLKEMGIEWTLVGHSERRQYFGETNATTAKRTEAALKSGFKVVHCIGETRAERESGKTFDVLKSQLLEGITKDASAFLNGTLLIAYEPVWAIGTGLTATPDQAEEAHLFVRDTLWKAFGLEAAGRTPILYGGSMTPQNALELFQKPNVDGGLVGGASLKAQSYALLVKAAQAAL